MLASGGWLYHIFTGGNASNDFAIAWLFITPIFFFALAIALGLAAVWVDRLERDFTLTTLDKALDLQKERTQTVRAAGGLATGATVSTNDSDPATAGVVRWRSFAIGSLAVIAFGTALVSLGNFGKLRQITTFHAVSHSNQYCSAITQLCYTRFIKGGSLIPVAMPYDVSVWAPLLTTAGDPVVVDVQVNVRPDALNTLPDPSEHYFYVPMLPDVTLSNDTSTDQPPAIAGASTGEDYSYFWRFIVRYKSPGSIPIDLRVKGATERTDPEKNNYEESFPIPVITIEVIPSFASNTINTSATNIAGIISSFLGVIGTLFALVKGQRVQPTITMN